MREKSGDFLFGQGNSKFLSKVKEKSENFIVRLKQAFILIHILNMMSHFTLLLLLLLLPLLLLLYFYAHTGIQFDNSHNNHGRGGLKKPFQAFIK